MGAAVGPACWQVKGSRNYKRSIAGPGRPVCAGWSIIVPVFKTRVLPTPPMTLPRRFALIPAAGVGARMGGTCPKQYLPLAGKPMLRHVLDVFAASTAIAHTFVVVSADDGFIHDLMRAAPHLAGKVTVLFNGGPTRQHTVLNGMLAAGPINEDDW